MDLDNAQSDPPSSWAAFAASEVGGSIVDDALPSATQAWGDAWWQAYQNAKLQVPSINQQTTFPPEVGNPPALAALTGWVRGRLQSILLDQAFWAGIIQRVANVSKPRNAPEDQFLGFSALYSPGLTSGCGMRSATGGRDVRLWTNQLDTLFAHVNPDLGDASVWARVTLPENAPQGLARLGLASVPGSLVPTWLVMSSPDGFGFSRVMGRLTIASEPTIESCAGTSLPPTYREIANGLATVSSQVRSFAQWVPVVPIPPLPGFLECPGVQAQYQPFANGPDVSRLTIRASGDVRDLVGLARATLPTTSGSSPRAFSIWHRSGDTFSAPTVLGIGLPEGIGLDHPPQVSISADGSTVAACGIGFAPAGSSPFGFGTYFTQANQARFPVVFHIPSTTAGWPAIGTTDTRRCGNMSMDATGSHLWWSQGGAGSNDGWWSIVPHPPGRPNDDTTPPEVAGTPSRPPDQAGYYREPVTVTWSATDPAPSSGAPTMPEPTIIEAEGAAVTVSSGASCDPAGNCATGSVTVAVDRTAPSVHLSVSPDPATSGLWWNTTPVVTAVCDDTLSGVATCPTPMSLGEGANQTVTGRAIDIAGNTADDRLEGINVDLTAPSIEPTVVLANTAPWYRTTPTVTFACEDQLSGVASCPSPINVGEGANQTVTGTAVDVAGNRATATITGLDVDSTAPAVTISMTPGPNSQGWNNQPVNATFGCDDDVSGIAACPGPLSFDDEGANQSATVTATDAAGNATTITTPQVNLDLTPPTVALASVTDGAVYQAGDAPIPQCATTDDLSGVAAAANLTVSGGNPDGTGRFTARCTGARDRADNATAPVQAVYEVHYRTTPEQFTSGPVKAAPTINTGRAGRTYPLRWQYLDQSGTPVNDLAAITGTTYQRVACTTFAGATDPLDAEATGNSGLSLDPRTGEYRFNWATPPTRGCYRLTIAGRDHSTIIALFDLT